MNIIYEKQVDQSFESALEKLKAELKKRNFGVLFELNFKDKLSEHNLEFSHNFVVLEVCNPGYAKKVLDAHMDVGYFMPCKMAVYEDANGVKLGMLKPSMLMEMTGHGDLEDIAANVDSIMVEAINAV